MAEIHDLILAAIGAHRRARPSLDQGFWTKAANAGISTSNTVLLRWRRAEPGCS
jgi:hypothetical protein